jgi:transcriptional regulator with XRE-family HTH domain
MTNNVLGAKLKKLRDEKNLTQAELSKILGFADNYVAKIESGTSPSMKTFKRLAAFFQIPVEYLVSEREDNAVTLPIRNQELFEVMLEVDKMVPEDRRLVLDVAKVIKEKNRLQEQVKRKKKD